MRIAVRVDAVGSGLTGVMVAAAAPPLAGMLGYPPALLIPVGIFLVGFAATIWLMAAPARISAAGVRGIVVFNAAWVLASVGFAASGAFAPTLLGVLFVLAQAAAVVGFSVAEGITLRRASRAGMR